MTSDQSRGARTVTMLFTDIEGSTLLLRRLGSRWGEALTAHRELVRAAVRESSGEEMGRPPGRPRERRGWPVAPTPAARR